jgi:hypothetical protein
MVPDAPPPHRLISSTPISLPTASTILATYIAHSEAHPHLHPDALITPTGVTFSSHGGPTGGVVLHALRRVAAGLRGEYLEPEVTPEPEDNNNEDEEFAGVDGAGVRVSKKGGKGRGTKTTFYENGGEVEWLDKEAYERAQGEIEVGDVGERSNVVGEGGEEPVVEVSGEKRKGGEEKLDKEARKRAKKERDAARKKEMEKKRAEKA